MTAAELAKLPLYKVQELALTEVTARIELGRRYASATTLSFKTERHRQQITLQYVRGWEGKQDPYFWKGGNFAAPMRRAWHAGKREHAEVAMAAAYHASKEGQ